MIEKDFFDWRSWRSLLNNLALSGWVGGGGREWRSMYDRRTTLPRSGKLGPNVTLLYGI